MPDFDEVLEPEGELVPLEPDAPLPLVPEAPGLPEVPVSPVPDPLVPPVPEVPLEPDVEPVEPVPPDMEPEVDEGDEDEDEALLPGVVVSVLLPEVLDGELLAEDDGVLDEPDEPEDEAPGDPLPLCALSQPVTAAPAKARTATTGMSFFMTSPIQR